jgi:hypothetical protein
MPAMCRVGTRPDIGWTSPLACGGKPDYQTSARQLDLQ